MANRPNVVLVHCHDLGRFLPSYGATTVPAPSLTAFAEEALVYEQAFSTAPLCTPARSSLFTGTSPHVNGLMGLAHHGWRYRRSVRTLPERLSAAGYRTALVGLQHEHPDPAVLGFDEVHGLGFLPRAKQVAEETERWLATRRGDEPFFLSVGFWETHRPWPADDYAHADPHAIAVPAFLPDNAHTRTDLAGFFGAVRYLDDAFGRLLSAIDAHTDRDDTLVLFTTDHGAAFPGAKGTLYDAGIGVALIARPPAAWQVPPGRRPELVSHVDVAATLLDLAGADADVGGIEGTSLVDSLRHGSGHTDRAVFAQKTYHDGYDPMRAVRTRRYKLIRNFAAGPRLLLSKDLEESPTRAGMDDAHLRPRPTVELYDLSEDPLEQHNLAEDDAHSTLRAQLESTLVAWMRDTKDPLVDGPIEPPRPTSRLIDAQPDL